MVPAGEGGRPGRHVARRHPLLARTIGIGASRRAVKGGSPATAGRAVGDHLGQGPDGELRVPDDANHDHEEHTDRGGRKRSAHRQSSVREKRGLPSETRAAGQGRHAQRGVN